MLNSYDEIWQYTERRLPVWRLGDNKLFCFVERETPPHVNERVKWLISFVRIALIHFIVSRALLIIPRSVFLTAFFGGLVHFWHRNIWLSRSLTVLMNSWNDFHKVACFPQVRATVKYAWLKNKWSRLLRKCWYSRGTSVWFTSLFYLVVSNLTKEAWRFRFAGIDFHKMQEAAFVIPVISQLTFDGFKHIFIILMTLYELVGGDKM